jgi:hypothetical protein
MKWHTHRFSSFSEDWGTPLERDKSRQQLYRYFRTKMLKVYILNPKPDTLHPKPETLHPKPDTLHPTPDTLHPKSDTYTLHRKLNSTAGWRLAFSARTPNPGP